MTEEAAPVRVPASQHRPGCRAVCAPVAISTAVNRSLVGPPR